MRKSRIQQVSMEVTVGFFMFMIVLALGVFTIILSRQNIFKTMYEYEIVFDSIMELSDGNNVMVRGLDLGQVKSLRLDDDGIHVVASIEKKIEFRDDYKIEILPSSVLGGRYLRIYEGSTSAPKVPEGTLLQGETPIDFLEEMTRTVDAIRDAMENGGILENLQATMEQVRDVTTRMSAGEGTLGKLMMDDKVYNDLQAVTENLRDISERITQGQGTLGKLLSDDDKLYNDFSAIATSIREISDKISTGEGTMGKLTTDDELYNELVAMIKDARATLDDIRETAPVATFTSIFFGAL